MKPFSRASRRPQNPFRSPRPDGTLISRLPSLFALVLFAVLATACTEGDPVTGSTSATVLTGSTFTLTERTLNGGTQMTARGTVKNDGKTGWSPVWTVEGQFYTDSTFTFKLGGATQSFSYSLAKGEQTGWELTFASSIYNLADYPHFAVKNLRVTQQ